VLVNRCYVCGNPEDDHREKCPLNNSGSTEKTKSAKVKVSAPTSAPPVETEELVEAVEPTPVATQKGLSGSQKKSLAGVAAGVLALGAIFYVATNNKTD